MHPSRFGAGTTSWNGAGPAGIWASATTRTGRADYIKQFEWLLPQAVKAVDPDRFYWVASPSSGGGFDDPNDQNRGDVHYWEVWHRLKPFTEYRKYHFRFCSEFGFQSFPSPKTIGAFTLPEDRNVFSDVMECHQKNGTANGRILMYLADNFLYPDSIRNAGLCLTGTAGRGHPLRSGALACQPRAVHGFFVLAGK